MTVTRAAGYRASRGKEQPAIEAVTGFFAGRLGVELATVDDPDSNWLLGDLVTGAGVHLEVKGQPVDPSRHPLNFVEVCEVTGRERHADGLRVLAGVLGVTVDELAGFPVWDVPSRSRAVFGRPAGVSVSVRTLASARATAYVNVAGGWLYVYGREELMGSVRAAVRAGMVRGAGRSNEDTVGVKVPLPRMRWRDDDGWGWVWAGDGDETDALSVLEGAFGPGRLAA